MLIRGALAATVNRVNPMSGSSIQGPAIGVKRVREVQDIAPWFAPPVGPKSQQAWQPPRAQEWAL